jgi:hypothetical protein
MPPLKTADGVSRLESFMKAAGGAAKEWYVGVSDDAEAQLEQRGMQGHPYATAISCKDEKTARAIAEHLRQTGVQPDKGSATPEKSPTQVYLFRAPKLTSFREWLKGQEVTEGEEHQREQKREEWVEAAKRLIGRCHAWLTEADSGGVLNVYVNWLDKAEAGLGRYTVPVLVVEHEDTRIHMAPFARNTARSLALPPGPKVQAQGRVDISNGMEKHVLYRVEAEGKEGWYLVPERGDPVALNQNVFMEIMEDLLS